MVGFGFTLALLLISAYTKSLPPVPARPPSTVSRVRQGRTGEGMGG